ncbi:MAG: hypothetical protein H6Q90_5745 [Deltaproteobacteria bacterium]|nr:hypothetical protein [Deltaproteobacteria bacterium]
MMIRTAWWVTALLFACASCDKSKVSAAGTAGSSEAPTGSGAAIAAADPWAGSAPPADSSKSKLGEKTGDDLSKIDPWGSGNTAAPTTLAAKVDVALIAQPVADKVSLKSLTGASSAGFKVTYNPSANATHEEYRKLFEQNHVFEEVAEGLNRTVRIPISVDINTVDCNTINAFYDPSSKRIIVCYELVSYFLGVFKPTAKNDTELGNAVIGALIFSFFHESGHGLIDILDLAAVGREEDSVDQLATLILIASGDEGVSMALSGAYWFHLQSEGGHKTPFWDEHAFDAQRFYNILCLIYGSDPKKYGEFLTSGNLPQDRAQRCPGEYAKIKHAWEKLLGPHLTNGAALNVDFKPSVPVAEAPKSTTQDPWGGSPTPVAPTPEPPAEDAPPTHAITCEAVGQKAAELIGAEAEQRAKSMSEDEIAELRAKLESELPAAMEQILAECAKVDWSDASRKCVINARTLAQASKCN